MTSLHRRGITLVELNIAIGITGVVMAAGIACLSLLKAPSQPPSEPASIDHVCDSLRRDLCQGGLCDPDVLTAGTARWQMVNGRLSRNGLPLLPLRDITWHADGKTVIVELRPIGQPSRTLHVTAVQADP